MSPYFKAGKGAYSNAISINPGASANDTADDTIVASSFLVFHSVLRNSQDYTDALRWSRILAKVKFLPEAVEVECSNTAVCNLSYHDFVNRAF